MGRDIDRERFDETDFERFGARLRQCLDALGLLLRRPGFGEGPATLGAELELFLVGPRGGALPINQKVLSEVLDPRLTYELDQFDLECNLSPVPLEGRPFAALGRELGQVLALADRGARAHGGRAVAVGILPTFRAGDFGSQAMTDVARYRVMSAALRRRRGEPFAIRLEGPDPLELVAEEAVLEGANASFQVHLRVAPARFAAAYNAAQLATAPVLAASGNSPVFLGHRLWQETRIGLVKQSVDDRPAGAASLAMPARVSFGRRWLDTGAEELFAVLVDQYPAVLPMVADEDPIASASAGRVPELAELRLHTGTVWLWNRPVYDPVDGGHLRVELRALPSGPTAADMVANAAFHLGLTLGMEPQAPAWTAGLAFEAASQNFYRAAQAGLDAEFRWPGAPGATPQRASAREVALRLLPLARDGLLRAGVEPADADPPLAVLEGRLESGQTGAQWQLRTLEALEPRLGRAEALTEMFRRYVALADAGDPVHLWPVDR